MEVPPEIALMPVTVNVCPDELQLVYVVIPERHVHPESSVNPDGKVIVTEPPAGMLLVGVNVIVF